jgi:hypothetical protein
VIFLLLFLPITYKGKMIFARMWRLQHRNMVVPLYLGDFALNSIHLELLTLTIVA